MSWSPKLSPRPRTTGLWHPTKVFNPLGGATASARSGTSQRTTRSRVSRGQAVPQRRSR